MKASRLILLATDACVSHPSRSIRPLLLGTLPSDAKEDPAAVLRTERRHPAPARVMADRYRIAVEPVKSHRSKPRSTASYKAARRRDYGPRSPSPALALKPGWAFKQELEHKIKGLVEQHTANPV